MDLEGFVAALQLPLLGGFVAGLEEVEAPGGGLIGSDGLGGASGYRTCEAVLLLPEAGTGEKAVFEARASHVLEIEVAEIELQDGADILVGEVAAVDAFVVSGEGDWDMGSAIEGQRMILASDAKDAVVGGEVDLDHDVVVGHLL